MKDIVEVFWRFLSLGCVSFGGPAAHIGYFRKTFVEQLNWLDDKSYASLVALSQFLPGPGSSQVGFALGLQRAGIFGGVAAFIGFTLPSFCLMLLLVSLGKSYAEQPIVSGMTQGLKWLAVVVVADAVLSMWQSFCTSQRAKVIASLAAALMLIVGSLSMQFAILIGCGLLGVVWQMGVSNKAPDSQLKETSLKGSALKDSPSKKSSLKDKSSNLIDWQRIVPWPFFIAFVLLLIVLPIAAGTSGELALFSSFYQAGSAVFGGGHVVLPLLDQLLGDAISDTQFLNGYAAAQAVPGPMFTLATFLGAEMHPDSMIVGATIATLAIFLPGFLLVLAFHDSWQKLSTLPKVASSVSYINAAVVGLLIAALYDPVFTSAVKSSQDLAWIVLGLVCIRILKWHIVWMVLEFVLLGVGLNVVFV